SMLAGAALAAEEVARMLRLPRRWGWATAMAAVAALPLIFRLFPRSIERPAGAPADPDALARLLAAATEAEPAPGLFDRIGDPTLDPWLAAIWFVLAAGVGGALLYTWLRLRSVRAGAD